MSDPVDDRRKAAYRHLIYQTTLETRPLQWMVRRFRDRLNPLEWRRFIIHSRRAGVVADLFHNLALFSALEFERFDEEYFWRELSAYEVRHPGLNVGRYRQAFETWLTE